MKSDLLMPLLLLSAAACHYSLFADHSGSPPPPVLQWLALLIAHTVCSSLNRQQTIATQPKHYDGLFSGEKKKKSFGDRCAGEA